jgi:hypothetical protein
VHAYHTLRETDGYCNWHIGMMLPGEDADEAQREAARARWQAFAEANETALSDIAAGREEPSIPFEPVEPMVAQMDLSALAAQADPAAYAGRATARAMTVDPDARAAALPDPRGGGRADHRRPAAPRRAGAAAGAAVRSDLRPPASCCATRRSHRAPPRSSAWMRRRPAPTRCGYRRRGRAGVVRGERAATRTSPSRRVTTTGAAAGSSS